MPSCKNKLCRSLTEIVQDLVPLNKKKTWDAESKRIVQPSPSITILFHSYT